MEYQYAFYIYKTKVVLYKKLNKKMTIWYFLMRLMHPTGGYAIKSKRFPSGKNPHAAMRQLASKVRVPIKKIEIFDYRNWM